MSLGQNLLVHLVGFHNLVLVPLLGKIMSYILGKYLASVSFLGLSCLATSVCNVCFQNNVKVYSARSYKLIKLLTFIWVPYKTDVGNF